MTKAERIDRVQNSLTSEDELLDRLPEIEMIDDNEVRDATIRTFMKGCPDYFWEKPTSSTGKYHSDDECGKFGNLIHTKRVFVEYDNISRSYEEADRISEFGRDCGRAAALIHDMMKYGWPSDQNDHTVSDHDLIGEQVARHIGECPDQVCRLVAGHNGPWYDGPTPDSPNEWLFHIADMSAAGVSEDDRAVYYASDEVLSAWPDLIVIKE